MIIFPNGQFTIMIFCIVLRFDAIIHLLVLFENGIIKPFDAVQYFIHGNYIICSCYGVIMCHWSRDNRYVQVCVTLIIWLFILPRLLYMVQHLVHTFAPVYYRCSNPIFSYLWITSNIVTEILVLLILSLRHITCNDPWIKILNM